jgi:hypothetical protein
MSSKKRNTSNSTPLTEFFPESGRVLLTGTGREFIQRIGVEATRQVILNVLMGENIRKQTEPLTQQRIAQMSSAMLMLFARGHVHGKDFSGQLSNSAVEQLTLTPRGDKSNVWLAQWLLGLTGKSVQNVLRSNATELQTYVTAFEQTIRKAAEASEQEYGKLHMTLGFVENQRGVQAELNWGDIIHLTTAIGSLTLTLRGSDKSTYGKLFERLILGSVLSILGFEQIESDATSKNHKVFWLSDSRADRECDATVLLQPGKVIRFDIGFIGPGNSEISKDKLSRYARSIEIGERSFSSQTFIIVDRLPETSKTHEAASKIGAEIVQMSMQYWPRELAQRLENRLGHKHPLSKMPEAQIHSYLQEQLAQIQIENFLTGISTEPSEEE